MPFNAKTLSSEGSESGGQAAERILTRNIDLGLPYIKVREREASKYKLIEIIWNSFQDKYLPSRLLNNIKISGIGLNPNSAKKTHHVCNWIWPSIFYSDFDNLLLSYFIDLTLIFFFYFDLVLSCLSWALSKNRINVIILSMRGLYSQHLLKLILLPIADWKVQAHFRDDIRSSLVDDINVILQFFEWSNFPRYVRHALFEITLMT